MQACSDITSADAAQPRSAINDKQIKPSRIPASGSRKQPGHGGVDPDLFRESAGKRLQRQSLVDPMFMRSQAILSITPSFFWSLSTFQHRKKGSIVEQPIAEKCEFHHSGIGIGVEKVEHLHLGAARRLMNRGFPVGGEAGSHKTGDRSGCANDHPTVIQITGRSRKTWKNAIRNQWCAFVRSIQAGTT